MSRLFARIAFLYTALAAVAGSAMAGVNPPASAPAAAVPALSEWSLLALVPLVGSLFADFINSLVITVFINFI